MRWDLILPGIVSLFVKLTGMPASAVTKADAPSKVSNPKVKGQLTFKISACNGLGEDEWRYSENVDDPTAQDLTICGTREFTLSVLAETYDAANDKMAQWWLERIYTRLARPSSIATLNALGCSWVDSGTTVDLGAVISEEQRIFSRAQKDFMFTGVVNERDDDESQPTGVILHVELASDTLDGVDGNPLPKQYGPEIINP